MQAILLVCLEQWDRLMSDRPVERAWARSSYRIEVFHSRPRGGATGWTQARCFFDQNPKERWLWSFPVSDFS